MKQSGFTLIEMVVVIALVGVLSVVVVDLLVGQYRIYNIEFSELEVEHDARQALDTVDNYVRAANHVDVAYDIYTTGVDTLVLSVESIDSNNQLVAGTFDQIVFHLNGSSLMLEVIPDAASSRQALSKALAVNLTALAFSYNNADMASVTEVATQLTSSHSNLYQPRSITISSKARLRNH